MKPFWSWSQAAAPEAMAAPAAPKGAGVPGGTSEPKKLESRLRCLSTMPLGPKERYGEGRRDSKCHCFVV